MVSSLQLEPGEVDGGATAPASAPLGQQIRRGLARRGRRIVIIVVAAIVAYLVIPPLGVVLFSSVRATQDRLPFEAGGGFSLSNLADVFGSAYTYRLALNTVWYAVGSVLLGLAIAVAFAWFIERTNMPARRFFFTLALIPMGIPGIVISLAWIQMANPANGLLNQMIHAVTGTSGTGPIDIYSIPGMILVQAMRMVPVIYLMISGLFSRIDPSLEEAGRTSGARSWVTFRRISLPLLAPGVMAALIYFLLIAAQSFETAALLGYPKGIYVFSSAIYFALRPTSGLPDYGLASAYGLILLVVALVIVYAYTRYVRRTDRFVTITGKGYRPGLIDLGKWRFVPAIGMLLYFVVVVLMPLVLLIWQSLAPPYSSYALSTIKAFNLNNYRVMLDTSGIGTATKNTLVIALATALLTMALVTLVSWFSVRRGGDRTARTTSTLTFVILGIPGIVLALALIFIYASIPGPVYGSIWIIVIGLATINLPFGTRLMSAALLQLHKELEEAAEASGAGPFRVLRRITLPLLWPSFIRGFLWIFVYCVSELTVTLTLQGFGNQTLAVVMWNAWIINGNLGLACAIGVPLMIFSGVLAYLTGRQTMFAGGSGPSADGKSDKR